MKHITEIKSKNKKDIIKLLYKKNIMSKKRIAAELELSPSVITKLCSELIKENILVEMNRIDSKKLGRKEVEIKINPNYKKCIGITINHISTDILLVDMQFQVIEKVSFKTSTNYENDLLKIVSTVQEIIYNYSLNNKDILGIGISIKGNTDGIYSYSGIWGTKVNIKDYIENHLNIPTVIDNGIRCSALLEQLYSNEDNFMFIKYMEPGIGGAIILNGSIKRGENNLIMDFGHMIIDTNSDYCNICKRKGCLESIISIEKILINVKNNFSKEFCPVLWEICSGDLNNINISNIIKAADNGCININNIFKKNAQYFALCLINTYSIMDVNKIIIIGDLFSSKRFVSYFRTAVEEYQLTDIYDKIEMHFHENVLLSPVALLLNEYLF
ncbi:hypothetical protein BHAMNSH16_04200 [Brachyspira hampsonii]|uniref:ROK family transcriptional regulator n=3 Tax=Brachyspira hampsonii TaxID=1287055 RepID=A0AAC9TSV6_9SPIR|nr:ROK family protein [Brachyspira hampsonii]ASJ20888.1 hypothetical protein BHAMNSH16_04200 [Brachyspira hampsonii]OEJ18913.1 hypothetical protein A9496_05755 [Brachyspira hampsonii]